MRMPERPNVMFWRTDPLNSEESWSTTPQLPRSVRHLHSPLRCRTPEEFCSEASRPPASSGIRASFRGAAERSEPFQVATTADEPFVDLTDQLLSSFQYTGGMQLAPCLNRSCHPENGASVMVPPIPERRKKHAGSNPRFRDKTLRWNDCRGRGLRWRSLPSHSTGPPSPVAFRHRGN